MKNKISLAILLITACKPADLTKNQAAPSTQTETETQNPSAPVDTHPCIPKDLYKVENKQPPTATQVLFWDYFTKNIDTPAFCWIDNVKKDTTYYAKKMMLCGSITGGGGVIYDATYIADELMASFRAQGFQPRATKNEPGDMIVAVGKPQAGNPFYPNGYSYYRVMIYFTDDSQIPDRECEE